MTDSKPIMDQVHELQVLVSRLRDLDVKVLDVLQICAILSKLPLSQNDYRNKVLHSTDKLTLQQFQTHLQIESETCVHDAQFLASSSMVNLVNKKLKGNHGN